MTIRGPATRLVHQHVTHRGKTVAGRVGVQDNVTPGDAGVLASPRRRSYHGQPGNPDPSDDGLPGPGGAWCRPLPPSMKSSSRCTRRMARTASSCTCSRCWDRSTKPAVEIGAGNGIECNAANLIINRGWRGLLFDGDEGNVAVGREFYESGPNTFWFPPAVAHAWITRENVNGLIAGFGFADEIDLFSWISTASTTGSGMLSTLSNRGSSSPSSTGRGGRARREPFPTMRDSPFHRRRVGRRRTTSTTAPRSMHW